ncbi:sigma factor-like helix-turn-helix DNA-binding protein [Streptomyces sp. DSM 44917]|uniref:Sigma factor-like helix-turn-helix DNA-binding protein n=1 Tax=Streptomyces boetiae TaxID=3075541 RepID=A0ABU2LB52_9ACTN|nr:sigma factor-like helix-turn-helix DNA-binding protein [Streptomyces sp. DSM 44917]MDT0308503.1 sigma factor-like helix-turn-helix DNA-binding protein [Streptomyces sp. DSM 44917]
MTDAVGAFDDLYVRHAAPLTRQAFLLCGHRRLAERSVRHAFGLAWQRWPEVAGDRDPAGWVRAAVHEYALSPWHGLVPGRRGGDPRAVPPEDRVLLEALLSLPRCYRRSLVLHDGVGLGLPETAAETESSTRAAASRVERARAALAARLPRLAGEPLPEVLAEFAAGQPFHPPPAPVVRRWGRRTAHLWTLAAAALTVTAAAALTAAVLAHS